MRTVIIIERRCLRKNFRKRPQPAFPPKQPTRRPAGAANPSPRCPRFDNRTLWPAPLNEITAHGTTRAQQDIMLLGAVTVLGASMNSHVRCAYGGKMISPSLQTFIVALPASGKGVLSLVRLLVELSTTRYACTRQKP